MRTSFPFSISRVKTIFYLFVLAILAHAFYTGLWLHQLGAPALIHPYADNTFWVFHLLHLPQFLVGSFGVALVFDLSLVLTVVLSLVYKKQRLFNVLFFLLFLAYFIALNSVRNTHASNLIGILLLSAVFCFNPRAFNFGFLALRYYLLFVMVSAALWKIFRGSIFHLEQMSESLKLQNLDYLVNHGDTLYAQLLHYIIQHPLLGQALFGLATLLQLSFIVGFFTSKYDRVLFYLFFCFFIGDYLLMDLSFIPLHILSITLLFKPTQDSKAL